MGRSAVWAGLVLATLCGAAHADDEWVVPAQLAPSPSPQVLPGTPPLFPTPPFPSPGSPLATPGSGAIPPNLTPPSSRGPLSALLGGGLTTPFASPTAGGGYQGRTYNEEFDGDFTGTFYLTTVVVGTTTERQIVGTRPVVITNPVTQRPVVVQIPVFGNVVVPVTRKARVPVAGRYSGILITDNDSPRPSNRLYAGYNYYDGLGKSLNPGLGNTTLHREMIGFEKTIFGGDTSIGFRLPFLQLNGTGSIGGDVVGDMSLLFKHAAIYNRETADVFSFGMVLTLPTGGNAPGLLENGSAVPHSVLFQPWVGVVRTWGRAYFQGIGSAILPNEDRDTFLLNHSLAFGYRVLDGNRGLLPSLTPTFEVHIRTPLNNRDRNGDIYFQQMVNLTGGAHVRWNRLGLSAAISNPVVGPRPWNFEALLNLNILF